MHKLKKALSLTVGLCFAVSLALTGCGSSSSSSSTDSSAKPAATVAPASGTAASTDASKLDPVKLKWYVIGNGQQPDTQAVLDEVNKYLKEKINTTLDMTCFLFGDDYEKKMTAKVAAGEEFDICFTSAWALNYGQNAAKGAFVDITDLIGKYAPKTKAVLGDAIIKGASINGKLYAIPTKKEMAHAWGFVVRTDLMQKYNLDINTIKKFTDIEPMLKVIKEKETGVYPLEAVTGESPFRVLDFESMADVDVPGSLYGDARDTKVINEYESPEAKDLFNTMHNYYKAGYIRKDADTVTDYSADTKAGKIFAALRSLKPGKDAELALAENQKWTQVYLTKPMQTTREMTGAMMAVSKSSKNPERALMFLELMNTDPVVSNLINFGIDGKHVKVTNGTMEPGPDYDKYKPGTPWELGNQFITNLFSTEDPKKWQKFDEFNASAGQSKVLGFTFDVEPVKTKVAALKSIKKQYVPSLETGKADPAVVLPQMNKKFADAGLADVMTEMQKQVDAFAAAQK